MIATLGSLKRPMSGKKRQKQGLIFLKTYQTLVLK